MSIAPMSETNTENTDTVEKVKGKPGRKPKYNEAMTPAVRTAKRREVLHMKITTGNPNNWDHQVCLAALTNKKYSLYQERAWARLGEINGWG